jgi:hypothetical protein
MFIHKNNEWDIFPLLVIIGLVICFIILNIVGLLFIIKKIKNTSVFIISLIVLIGLYILLLLLVFKIEIITSIVSALVIASPFLLLFPIFFYNILSYCIALLFEKIDNKN